MNLKLIKLKFLNKFSYETPQLCYNIYYLSKNEKKGGNIYKRTENTVIFRIYFLEKDKFERGETFMKFKVITIIIVLVLIFTSSAIMAAEKINLAVMNFSSEGNSQSSLGNGFSETLTGKLDNLGNVNIIKREKQRAVLAELGIDINQSFDAKNTQTIGEVLDADYVLTGNLKENGDGIDVKYQLVNVGKGTVVAEETVSGTRDRLFDIQGDMGVKIANHFNSSISDAVKEELYLMPTQNMESFENFSSGLNFYNANRVEEAYNFFLSSVSSDTSFTDAHRFFEYTARKTGQLKDFIKNYEEMLAKDPGNPILMNYLGNGYFDSGDYAKAESLYKESIKKTPTFSNPHNNLAIIYSIYEKYDEAIKEFEKALETTKEPATVYNNIGLCYVNMKDIDKAKTYFEKALELEPANPNFVVARHYIYGSKIYVTYKEKKVPGSLFGEIALNTEPVFEVQNPAGGLSSVERAEIIAGRLQELIDNDLKSHDVQVGKINNQITINTANQDLIMTITKDMADREGTTIEELANYKMDILKEILSSSSTISYSMGGFILQACKYKISSEVIHELKDSNLYMITPETLTELEGKIPSEKFGVLGAFQHQYYPGEKMTQGLTKNGFTEEEIAIVLDHSAWVIDTEKLATLLDREFSSVYKFIDELKDLGYDADSVDEIGRAAMELDRDENDSVIITDETLSSLEGKVDIELLNDLKGKEISIGELKESLINSDLKVDEIDQTLTAVATEKDMRGISEEATCLHNGDKYYSKEQVEVALEQYNKALSINPDFAPAHFCIALVSYEAKDYKGAEDSLNSAIKSNPGYFEAYLWLGKIYLEEGKGEEAKVALGKALEIEPGNLEAQNCLEKVQ